MDLAQFLRDRLDEDEREQTSKRRITWKRNDPCTECGEPADSLLLLGPDLPVGEFKPCLHTVENMSRLARYTEPAADARALAEVEAKQRLLVVHAKSGDFDGCVTCDAGNESCGCMGGAHWTYPCDTVKLLALPYAGHPDYRQEWRP